MSYIRNPITLEVKSLPQVDASKLVRYGWKWINRLEYRSAKAQALRNVCKRSATN